LTDNAQLPALSWRARAKGLADTLINFVFPPVCSTCKTVGSLFCDACRSQIQWLEEPLCACCGRVVSRPVAKCTVCQRRPLPLQQVRAAVLFSDPIPKVIHHMKYNGLFALAQPLANLMVEAWTKWQIPVDLVVPIPLHPDRQRERGYNQSDLLTRHLSEQLNLAYDLKALRRTRHTSPQVGLSAVDRLTNVQNAFWADARVAGKHVLLIDDVCTTGATMAAAAEALLAVGAKTVSGYCVARAL